MGGWVVYEVMLLVIPELDEEQASSTVERARAVIRGTGGDLLEDNVWGRRRLAYDIGAWSEGYYAVLGFSTGDRTLEELRRILGVSDDVLRYMIVKRTGPTWTTRTATRSAGSSPSGGKIRGRKVTKLEPRHQRQVATTIKRAREMALLPYRRGR